MGRCILCVSLLFTSYPLIQAFKFPIDYKISFSAQNKSSCVALENCGSLRRMWETRYTMMNSLEVLQSLEKSFCGFLGFSDTPIFRCPEPPENLVKRMFIGEGSEVYEPCSGTVKLFVINNPEPQEVVHDDIAKMKMLVDRIIVTGNCCWRLHTKKMFRGRSLNVRAGATHNGIGTVKSVERLEDCQF